MEGFGFKMILYLRLQPKDYYLEPRVTEFKLKADYPFMHENFLITTQHEVFLLLMAEGESISVLKFNSLQYKYGYPNDEGGHPLGKFGLGFYGVFEVKNSPWLIEIISANEMHPNHSSSLYKGYRHIICRFKDVTFEVLCRTMEETRVTKSELLLLVQNEIGFLQTSN